MWRTFYFHLENELFALQDELTSGSYQPRPYRCFTIYEPKERKISAADIRDRVVHHAVCHVLDPVFERHQIHDSYACRRDKGTHAAIQRAQQLSRRYAYYLKCDIHQYFARVDHEVLKTLLRRKIKDARLLDLLDIIIDHPIPDESPGRGLAIGNLTSQYFANHYLAEMDHRIKTRLRCKGYIRYMDDFVLFGNDKAVLREARADIGRYIEQKLRLTFKDKGVFLAPVMQGLPFLGFRIYPGMIRMDGKKWTRFRRKVDALESDFRSGMIDEDTLAKSVSSMIGHIVHSDSRAARKHFFTTSLALG